MKTAYLKDCVRKLKSSIFQYISIILIIVLGVGFFIGMNVVSPNMEITAENYLKDNNVYDIQLISTIGWKEEDIEKAREYPDVTIAEGAYTADVLVEGEEKTLTVRLNSILNNDLNKMDLIEGNKPENVRQCVIDIRMQSMYGYQIGDIIELKSGTDENISDIVSETELEIVGITRNPIYLTQYYGITALESGELLAYLMVDKDLFKLDEYTAIYIKTNIDNNIDKFSDEYKERVEEIGPKLLKTLEDNTKERCDTVFDDFSKEIEEAKQKLKDSEKELADNEKLIVDAEKQVKENENTWNEAKTQYQVNSILNPGVPSTVPLDYINQMLTTIEKNKKDVESKRKEFDNKKIDYDKKIEENKKDLEDAEYQLDNFKVDIYESDLTENEGFVSLKNDLVKIGMMGKVFPVMFFIVASLVTITTVSRTIEEERGNIGILKALGYGNFKIARKFIIYSLLTSLLGIVIGVFVGNTLICPILFTSYGSLYVLPDMKAEINWFYTILVIVILLVSIVGVTIIITMRALREKASELMRPKAVKEGKNIALEKVGFLWKRFNFFYKSSFRNIFRYKRRLAMAIIGIAGCTALIYSGFALKQSIDSIAVRQFSIVKFYDMEINLNQELDEEKVKPVLEFIKENENIKEVTPIRQQSTSLYFNDQVKDLFYTVIDKNDLKDFINLKERKTNKELNLTNNGIVITEKLSRTFGIKEGDTVKVGDDVNSTEIKVVGIAENYIYNYIYMTPEVYEKIYDKELKYNQFFANTEDLTEDEMNDVASDLKENEKISGIMLTSNVDKEYQKSLQSLMSIVLLCIGCASLLAFIVLINLNIINIAERKRELATLKLLGFFDKEVSSYVFRENIILTIFGILAGLGLGVGVLGIIMQSAEVETIMLPNEFNIKSFAFATILTLSFTLITNFVMNPKIKKIDMIDSLKSVE